MTILVRYEGRVVATVGATRAYLAPEIERLPDSDPLLRFVVMMCSYALDVGQGVLAGPYDDEIAALYARAALIEAAEFAEMSQLEDAAIAAAFAVPMEQVKLARADVAAGFR